jgi:hypothetical protein
LGGSHTTVYKWIAEFGLDNVEHPAFSSSFVYDESLKLEDYIRRIFTASFSYHGKRSSVAIKQLDISSGYFYKVIKAAKAAPENPPCFQK